MKLFCFPYNPLLNISERPLTELRRALIPITSGAFFVSSVGRIQGRFKAFKTVGILVRNSITEGAELSI